MKLKFLLILIIVFIGCRERYGIPFNETVDSYLVVEGNILDGDTTVIRLSRTSALGDRGLIPQKGADVKIEADDNTTYALNEMDEGVYKSHFLTLKASGMYRLRILLGDRQYESALVPLLQSPEIDTVTWQRDDGVKIYVSSRGTPDQTRYYKWDYDEVWEFRSLFESKAFFTTGPGGPRDYQCIDIRRHDTTWNTCVDAWYPPGGFFRNDSMYLCWKYVTSSNIHVGSTASLSDNVVYMAVRHIPENAWELNEVYSILVKQTGLSKEAYEFYKVLESNSENIGSIFDPQPSELKTNITCITNPEERVIGFVDATTVRSKRIFIRRSELPGWRYVFTQCSDSLVGYNIPDSVHAYIGRGLIPIDIKAWGLSGPYRIDSFSMGPKPCVDCRLRGVPIKPPFWP